MNIFVIVAQPNPNTSKLAEAVAAAFPENIFHLADGVWMVAGTGTSEEVSRKIGVTGADAASAGQNGAAVILAVSGYFGLAGANVWEWMKAKAGAP